MIKITRTEHYIYYQSAEGYFHRPNGPAVYYHVNERWAWWLYGNWHRYYGAHDTFGGWRIHGKKIK
jgi:hypothetical protein